MPESEESSVAVYIDFDNVVISREDQARRSGVSPEVSLDAILDYATKYGRVSISRAYADWSNERNAAYRRQLVDRAVDLTQLFQTTRGMKNGADIRMAIDVVEDLYRHDDITHVVIVAGDSDYIPLAQRIRRLGREVIGIGVAGSISGALASACDEYRDYDELAEALNEDDDEESAAAVPLDGGVPAPTAAEAARTEPVGPRLRPGPLLLRALRLLDEQHPERDWHALSAVKNQMLRMAPGFQEKAYGATSFGAFVKNYPGQVEVKDNRARIKPAKTPRASAS